MNFPHILVVSASAGSGKTFALSRRYITFLLSPEISSAPRNILAITFTNKAAGEMKHRIIRSLKEIAIGDARALSDALIDIKLKENSLCQAAGKVLDELLDRYSDLKVQTIDSFLTSVIKSSTLELDLPPNFEIVLDSSASLNFVLDELLSRVYPNSQGEDRDITHLFIELLNEILRINEEAGWDIKGVILDNISVLREQEFLKGQVLKKISSYKDYENKRNHIAESIKGFLAGTEARLNFKKHFLNAAGKFIEDRQFQPWDSKMFLKQDISELCKKGSSPSEKDQKSWEGICKDISLLAEIIAHCRFAPFINFLTLFDEGIQLFKDRQQSIFIEDLNVYLRSLLVKEGIVPEIYFHLGDRILHFFIDEFQDTSRFQWENLSPLVEETLSKAGSLFYVGDKKQAIYEFRGGESALFDEAKVTFPSVAGRVEERFPETNYRSRENIVSFANKTFSEDSLMLWIEKCNLSKETVDTTILLKTYAHSAQKADQRDDKKGGLVKVERISPQEQLNKEAMDIEIGSHLADVLKKDILGRFSPSDIAVLVRTNDEASLVTKVLTRTGISVASERTLNISSNTLIQEIVSFLAFLDSPIDNLSFACFISGDIFQKVSGLSRNEIFSFLLQNRSLEGPHRQSLYVLFRDRFPQVWEKHIEEYFNAVGFLPVYDLVFRILQKYNVFQRFADDEGFFYQFLEVLKQTEKDAVSSPRPFLDYWYSERKKENFEVVLPEYTDAVKVLTIHKAKGLGFPVVIIPFAYLNNSSINRAFEKHSADSIIPYYINKGYIGVSPKLRALYKQKFNSQLVNELNTFYVAVTRAKEELYIFLPNYKSATGKLSVPVFPEEDVLQIGMPLDCSARAVEQKEEHLYPALTNEWQDKLHRPRIRTDELTNFTRKEARERGILIHRFLADVERLPEKWRESLEQLFVCFTEEDREIIPVVKGFFEVEPFRKWFILPESVLVWCEKEIVDIDGSAHRVDRVLLYPEKVVAIDFKCGEPRTEEHSQQVATYLELLSGIFPDKTKEGWLVYVDDMTQEKVPWEE